MLRRRALGDLAPEKAAQFRCRNCGAGITSEEHLYCPDGGRHQFLFHNPAGVACDITCFSAAWGLAFHGAPQPEYTWFFGFSWRVASCLSCGTHLGWRYEADHAGTPAWFFGLLTQKLARFAP